MRGDVGAQKTCLRAAIVPLALELHAVEFLLFRKSNHRVGELDLAAGAALLGFQDLEDFRLQNVAPGDREVGRRGAFGGFSTMPSTSNILPWRLPTPQMPY